MGNVVTDSGLRIPITDAGVELWEDPPDTNTGWTDNGGGNYTNDGTNATQLRMNVTIPPAGETYLVTFDVTAYTSGDVKSNIGGNTSVVAGVTGTGSYSIIAASVGTQGRLGVISSIFNGTIDNISVKPLHYNADASGPFGYLSESAGTNLLTYSEEFDNAAWTKQLAVVTADDTVAPDGTSTADKLADNNATGTGEVSLYRAFTVLSGADYTLSIYAKADLLSFLYMYTNGFDALETTWFDLSTGAVGTQGHSDAGIEAVGNGWFRCWVALSSTTDLSGYIQIRPASADNDKIVDLDGTSSIYIWGAQCEAGTFPTSYIKTEAATVTRSADVLTYDDVGNIEDAAGTAKCEASTLWGASPGNVVAVARSGNNRTLYLASEQSPTFIRVNDDTSTSASQTGGSMYGTPQSIASAWGDELTAYINGAPDLTPASYDGTIGSGDIGIGCRNTGDNQWDGTIRLLEISSKEGDA